MDKLQDVMIHTSSKTTWNMKHDKVRAREQNPNTILAKHIKILIKNLNLFQKTTLKESH